MAEFCRYYFDDRDYLNRAMRELLNAFANTGWGSDQYTYIVIFDNCTDIETAKSICEDNNGEKR